MGARGRTFLAAGAGTAVLVFVVSPFLAGEAPDAAGTAVLPERLAGYSLLTGDVAESPPGRAVALLQHGYGVELLDLPQAVVVGWGADAYRRVGEAEDRAGPETQGDPAPMLLSPDGRRVAVGDHDTDDPDLAMVDLATGVTTRHPLPGGESIRPVAWSPDGRRVAYLSSGATDPSRGDGMDGELTVLDLSSGRTEAVPGADDAVGAAFDPSGTRLAVQHVRASAGALTLVDLVDGRTREAGRGARLAGPAAWSPDGRVVAVVQRGRSKAARVAFVDARTGRRTTDPVLRLGSGIVGSAPVLGWTGEDEVVTVLPLPGTETWSGTAQLAAVPLDGGEPEVLVGIDGLDSFGVARLQLAQDALADVEVRAVTEVDRGPWPWPWRLALAVATGALVAVAAAWGTAGLARGAARRTARARA